IGTRQGNMRKDARKRENACVVCNASVLCVCVRARCAKTSFENFNLQKLARKRVACALIRASIRAHRGTAYTAYADNERMNEWMNKHTVFFLTICTLHWLIFSHDTTM